MSGQYIQENINNVVTFVTTATGSLNTYRACIHSAKTTATDFTAKFDNVAVRPNTNIGTVAQATYFGGMSNAGANSCAYSESTSSGTSNFIDLGTGSSCAAWTVDATGTANGITAQGTNDHRLNVAVS